MFIGSDYERRELPSTSISIGDFCTSYCSGHPDLIFLCQGHADSADSTSRQSDVHNRELNWFAQVILEFFFHPSNTAGLRYISSCPVLEQINVQKRHNDKTEFGDPMQDIVC